MNQKVMMNRIFNIGGLLVLILLNQKLIAAEWGELMVSGGGCTSSTVLVKPVSGVSERVAIKLNTYLKKEENETIKRAACGFAWPLKLDANERLVVSDLEKNINFRLNGGDLKTTAQLELFISGKRTEPYKLSVNSSEVYSKTSLVHLKKGHVFQSSCGEDLILRAQEAITGIGSQVRGRIYGEDLKLTLNIEKCN